MRIALALVAVAPGCKLGFEAVTSGSTGSDAAGSGFDAALTGDGPASDGPACATPTVNDWSLWPVANDVGSGRPHIRSMTPSPDGMTVTDNITTLVWESGEHAADAWAQAQQTCDNLVLAGACDWRLPTRAELISLVDYARFAPAQDVGLFPGMQSAPYWTSVEVGANQWYVDFTNGSASVGGIAMAASRCVRGVVAPPTSRFLAGGGIVHDNGTGLDWEQVASTSSFTLMGAEAHCAGLGAGWRSPAVQELESIVDTSNSNPSLDPVFTNAPVSTYWTDTVRADDATSGWTISFDNGYIFRVTSTSLPIRCVR